MNQEVIPKYLLDTDILADHLITDFNEESYLIRLLKSGICFTSVLNAAELYRIAETNSELQRVNEVLYGIKVLGIHARYSLSVPNHKKRFDNVRDLLFYILAESNKLTIVSFNPDKFSYHEVKSLHPGSIVL